jgi:plasmid stability protein
MPIRSSEGKRAVELSIELDDSLMNALQLYAQTIGTSPEELAHQILRKHLFGSGTQHSEAFERNIEAFYSQLPELLERYEGMCVAFRDGKLVEIGTDRINLLKKMYARYGYSDIFVTQVARTLRVRHVGHRQLLRRRHEPL